MAIESFDKKKMGICADLVLIAIESFALVVSLWLSVTLREGEWFQRSGAYCCFNIRNFGNSSIQG